MTKHVIVIYCVFFIAVNVKGKSKSLSDTVGFLLYHYLWDSIFILCDKVSQLGSRHTSKGSCRDWGKL